MSVLAGFIGAVVFAVLVLVLRILYIGWHDKGDWR
jgi:hypothetical protein